MRQKWIDFGAGWKRRPGNVKIPSKTSESIYFVGSLNWLYSFLLKGQNLTALLVHRYRATQKIQSFNRPANSALYDSAPFCHSDEAPLEEGLVSIQTSTDLGTGSCSLFVVHLYFRQGR